MRILNSITVVVTLLITTAWSQGSIIVGPNTLVSRNGDVAHVESHIAANPKDPNNLLGTAISFTSPAIGTETQVYVSFDGGWTWTDRYFEDQRRQGAWDPQVGFGVTGTAYLVTMTYRSDSSTMDNAVAFYRSEDGGKTWGKPAYLGFKTYDRNAIVVDNTRSRFHGRVYVTSHSFVNERADVRLFWSADDGRTFQGPVSTGCSGVNYILVLTDGTLWIPCDTRDSSRVAVVSTNGGKTLTPVLGGPKIESGVWAVKPKEVTGYLYTPVYAVDPSRYYRNRIYELWITAKGSGEGIMLRYSNDQGRTWTEPRRVASVSREGGKQYLPMAAVNRDGVLGVVYFESHAPENDTYDVFFTASRDGGDSFLPTRRVTSATSQPDHPENRAITKVGGVRKKSEPLFYSAYSRFKNAGDYTGLTADADGVFHPFWPDARRGAFQLYTSRITVENKPLNAVTPIGKEATVAVDEAVNVEYGPPVAPRPGEDEIIVARIRNVSTKTIFGPIALTVTVSNTDKRDNANIFDPQSGQWLRQARIDYTPALRDIPFLTPGAATEAIEWRFRNVSRGQLNLTTHVYAGHYEKR